MIKKFLFTTENITRSSYIWNTAGGIINALQSIILLAVISRTVGIVDAGVFSIAWAIAYLALTLGNYGMRPYQVTDSLDKYSVETYISSRIITCCLMVVFTAAYVIYGVKCLKYNNYKCVVIILLTLWKILESFEDVYHGWFQKSGRLDVAAKAVTIRYIVGILAFTITIFITGDMIIAIVALIVASVIALYACTLKQVNSFATIEGISINKRTLSLLGECFTLCVVTFLTIYLANAPKYAIDASLTDELQAYFNYIFMPVFAIGLLASFIYNPLLKTMADAWNNRETQLFKNIILKQIIYIAIITIAVLVGAYLVGTQILGLIFGVSVTQYRLELLILLLGGGMIALANFIMLILATWRKQWLLVVAYGVAAISAKICTAVFVKDYGIEGAAWSYTVSTTILALLLLAFLIIIYHKQKNKGVKGEDNE